MNFADISNQLSLSAFEQIKNFVLNNGDRQTYRNFDNNNPHYRFKNFDIFLGSAIGQRNINNDPALSDFNQLTIYDSASDIRYYELIIVRPGDLSNQKYWLRPGMNEGCVYLVDVYGKGLETMKTNLRNYLQQIRSEI